MKAAQIIRLLPILFLVAGCASTVQSRIEENPSVFDSFPVDIQEKVRNGEVSVGYTKPMVEIALGRPDRVYTRKTEGAMNEIWVYMERLPRSRISFGFGVGSHMGSSGDVLYRHHHPMFMDNDDNQVEKMRIEWDKTGRVKAVEEVQ